MAAQHIHGLHAGGEDLVGPALQLLAGPHLEGVQHQAGEEEVVDHVALLGDGLVGALAVACVDLRQQLLVLVD